MAGSQFDERKIALSPLVGIICSIWSFLVLSNRVCGIWQEVNVFTAKCVLVCWKHSFLNRPHFEALQQDAWKLRNCCGKTSWLSIHWSHFPETASIPVVLISSSVELANRSYSVGNNIMNASAIHKVLKWLISLLPWLIACTATLLLKAQYINNTILFLQHFKLPLLSLYTQIHFDLCKMSENRCQCVSKQVLSLILALSLHISKLITCHYII